jgi:hypothetical protein
MKPAPCPELLPFCSDDLDPRNSRLVNLYVPAEQRGAGAAIEANISR